jgi:cytidylate kinase
MLSQHNRFIIAIDGPSSTGKTTLSKALSKQLNLPLLLTGKIYRAYAKHIMTHYIDPENPNDIATSIASDFDLSLLSHNLDGEDIAKIASIISSIAQVRKLADQLQHDFIKKNPKAILEGRDIGTVICPDANVKIFLTATAEVRAQRRFRENPHETNYEMVLKQIIERDHRDSVRSISPLIPADDAIIIDNSNLSEKEQLTKVLFLLDKFLP